MGRHQRVLGKFVFQKDHSGCRVYSGGTWETLWVPIADQVKGSSKVDQDDKNATDVFIHSFFCPIHI